MNRGAKIIAASVVLASGMVVALLFKQATPQKLPLRARDYGQLELRKTTGLQPDDHGMSGRERTSPHEIAAASRLHRRDATFLTPVTSAESPPLLPTSYPGDDSSDSTRSGTLMGFNLPSGNAMPAWRQTHRIVDGDTLCSLAERYLASADRHAEIYEANRGVLSNPDILPIGVKLKIPPRRNRPAGR